MWQLVARWMRDFAEDVAYALRRVRSAPGFSALTALTAGLGIGATTAIFTVVNTVVLRPIPVPNADRVVQFYETNPNNDSWTTSEPNFLDYRERTRSFSSFAAITGRGASLLGRGDPTALNGLAASASYFTLFGGRPLVGATYGPDEDRPGGDTHVVLLSEALWRKTFGSDRAIVGRAIDLDGVPYRVLGVMPARYGYLPADFWVPLAADPASNRGSHLLQGIALMKSGVTVAQANADVKRVAAELSKLYPKSNGLWGARVESFTDSIVGPTLRKELVVLLGAVGSLLLLACANVANLLLARASTRQREMAVRAALGAGSGRIARQLFAESLVLSFLGAAIGIAITWAAIPLVRSVSPADVPRLDEVTIDLRVLGFALALAMLTGIAFGLAPAWHAARADLQDALRQGSRSITGAGVRLRSALVVVEFAMAVMLLVGAGLLARSFVRLTRVPPGFEMRGVLQLTVSAPNDLARDQRWAFFHRIEQGLAAAPGVESVGASSIAPFDGNNTNTQFLAEGHESRENEYFAADWRSVTPGMFATLRIPRIAGRLFDETDVKDHQRVAVVDETMAKRLWPGQDPLGKWIMGAQSARTLADRIQVVGVVRDVRDQAPATAPGPAVYFPEAQWPWVQMTFFVRARSDAASPALADAVRRAFRDAAPSTPVPELKLLSANTDTVLAPQRFTASLLASFAVVALVLAAIGLYGVIAFGVGQRRSEIGIRLAFGASPARVIGLIMREASVTVTIGAVVGCAAALALSRLITSLLFATEPTDVATYAGVILTLVAVAALASYLPARHAARIDPLVALRDR